MIFTIAGISVAVDTLLNNRFAIHDTDLKPLGEGGMAVIYAGFDTDTNLPIAAKTLRPEFQGNAHRRERFRREAEVLKAVQHPHIVELIDFVDSRRGSWIMMEYLEGENLRDKLKREERAFTVKQVNQWLAQICSALEHMHILGYVHLDITPQNLFLTNHGDIKLIDFGIAQKAFAPPTREGDTILGTAPYISPEHGGGQVVTPSSDIYSLGCVMFELLTDRKIFSEYGKLEDDETISMRQSRVPELPSNVVPELGIPTWVDTVIGRALMPDPGERFPSVTALAEEFNALANPPLLRFFRSNRSRQEPVPTMSEVPAVAYEPQVSAPTVREPRQPSRAGRWMRKELRNARRVTLVFALLLAIVVGAPMLGGSAAFDRLLGSVPGSNTEVVDGNWYMRAGPTTESAIRTLMMDGQSVRVTGTPVVTDEQLWWPVSSDVDGQRTHGWAHDDGLQRTWLMNRAAGLELMQASWSNRWNAVTDILPG